MEANLPGGQTAHWLPPLVTAPGPQETASYQGILSLNHAVPVGTYVHPLPSPQGLARTWLSRTQDPARGCLPPRPDPGAPAPTEHAPVCQAEGRGPPPPASPIQLAASRAHR